MRLESKVHTARTATATTASNRISTVISAVSFPWGRAATNAVRAAISRMFASRETHWHSTFPAMYFLLSGTARTSRLFSIPSILSQEIVLAN